MYVLADLEVRFKPSSPLLGMAAVLHPGNKSLAWLTAAEQAKIHRQLRAEVLNIAGVPQEDADDHEEDEGEEKQADAAEPPAKKAKVDAAVAVPAAVLPAEDPEDDDIDMFFFPAAAAAAAAVPAPVPDVAQQRAALMAEVRLCVMHDRLVVNTLLIT